MSSLNRSGWTVLIWVFTGSGIVLTAGRYIIRLKTVKTFKADDYVHGLALIVLICYVSTYTVMLPLNYAVEFWIAGTGKPPSEADLRRFVHLEIAIATQFLVVMYLVKLAFLLFYWSIFNVSRLFMKAWWLVTIFTLLTFLANFIAVFWSCVTPRDFLVLERCLSQQATQGYEKIVSMWCGLNVASDVSIMALPIWMLQKLQMPMSRKLGLAALFLIAITDVIFDITRTVYTVRVRTSNTIWDIIEPAIAVIVSALPTYKALLGNSTKKKKWTPSYENLKDSRGATRHDIRNGDVDPTAGIELGTEIAKVSRNPSIDGSVSSPRFGLYTANTV